MSFIAGIRCFFNALSLAPTPQYRRYAIVPGLVSLVVIVLGLSLAFSYISDLGLYLQQELDAWPEFIQWILQPLLYIIGILVGAWLFGFLSILIVSPFLGVVSAQADPPDQVTPRPWYAEVGPALARELRKLRYSLPRLLGLLLLSLIPVLNVFSPLLWLGFGAWLMAVQFADFSFENRNQNFTTTLETLRQARGAALGYGVCVTIGMSIPFLNFMVAPVAAIGGGLLVRQIREST